MQTRTMPTTTRGSERSDRPKPGAVASRALGGAIALAVLAVNGGAQANAPAPFSRPTGAVPGMVVERASPLLVEREELVVDCAKEMSPLHPRCTFVATYALRNPAAGEEELLGAFYTTEAENHRGGRSENRDADSARVTAALDGVDARAEATEDQLRRMDTIVLEDPELGAAQKPPAVVLRRQPFRIIVRGGAKASLVFTGELQPTAFAGERGWGGYQLPAIATRHPGLAKPFALGWDTSDEDYLYLISPIRRWSGDPDVHVSVRYRGANDFSPSASGSAWTHVDQGDVVTSSTVFRAGTPQNLRFRLSYRPSPLHNGGPLVGIGPRIAREELRFRFGYEVGLSSFMIVGASAETNFDEYATAATTLDFATPSFIVIPSFSLGAGPTVQFRTHEPTRVGARSQLTISWPLLSLVFPVDYYPVAGSAGSHFEGAFLTQLSF